MDKVRKQLSQLETPSKNVRIHPQNQVKEIARSVEMFGQLRPLIIDEEGKILAGNGLFEALKHLGWEEADAYEVSGLTEAQKKKLMIADNKTFELGLMNNENLIDILEELKLEQDLEIPGFDTNLLEDLLSDEDEIKERIEDFGKLDEEATEVFEEKREKVKARSEQKQQEQPEEVELESDNIQLDEEQNNRPYIICKHCNKKNWL